MRQPDDWAVTLLDRLHTTPAGDWIHRARLSRDDRPIVFDTRHGELFALIGRSVKQGRDLALFLPLPEPLDACLLAAYLYILHFAVMSRITLPRRWGNPDNFETRSDLILAGQHRAYRTLLTEQLRMGGQTITSLMHIAWPAYQRRRNAVSAFHRVGLHPGPGLYLLGPADLSAERLERYAGECKPFAVLLDLTDQPSGPQGLAALIRSSHRQFPGVPLIVLAPLGDKVSLRAVRDADVPVWALRAGDVQCLTQLANNPSSQNSGTPTRLARSAAALANGIHVRLLRIRDDTLGSAISAATTELRTIEDEAGPEDADALGHVRAALRQLVQLSCPLRAEEAAYSASTRTAAYVSTPMRNRLDALRGVRGRTGAMHEAFSSFCDQLESVYVRLQSQAALTGKAAALVEWLRATPTKDAPRWIVASNELTVGAINGMLSREELNLPTYALQVLTRTQAWREASHHLNGCTAPQEILWIGSPDFQSAAFFAGAFPKITLLVYDWEIDALQQQLAWVAHDTQATSRRNGDKLRWLRGTCDGITDRSVEPSLPACWQITEQEVSASGVYPDALTVPPSFAFPDRDWMAKLLEDTEPSEDAAETTKVATSAPRIVLTLDDGEPDVLLPLGARVLVMDESTGDTEGLVTAEQLRKGMTVLLARDRPDVALLDRLFEHAKQDPEFAVVLSVASLWQSSVDSLASLHGGSYQAAFARLKHYGVSVRTPQAVYAWFHGLVQGPRSPADLCIMARAANRPDLETNWKPVHIAIKYVRRVRLQLAKTIRQYVRHGFGVGRDRLIDHKLNLYRSDLEQLTRVGTIQALHTTHSAAEN